KTIMLQYHTTGWLHRANWGDEDAIPYGEKNTTQKVLMGALPKAGEWVRLEIDAEKIGLKPGAKITGMAFTQFGGTVYWDKAGIVTKTSQEDISATSELAWERQEMSKDNQALPRDVREAVKLKANRRTPEQKKLLNEYYIANVYAPARS